VIDLLTAFIVYLGSDADLNTLTSGRIAAKHKFGMGRDVAGTQIGWPDGAQALQLSYAGGETPDLSGGMLKARLDTRCYGASQEEAAAVHNRLITIADAFQRTVVETGDGKALLYWLVLTDSPQFDRDPDIGIDMVRTFLKAACAKETVI
jgi:hypothetical protein